MRYFTRTPMLFIEKLAYLGHTPEKSVAVETALEMASPAYRRAVHLSAGNRSCLGVACTATIATDRRVSVK